jgi:hypothetical protein
MARKTSSRRRDRTSKGSGDGDKKRGGNYKKETMNEIMKDCETHEPDCQCYLRKGIFLPPGVNDPGVINQQDTKQKI